MELQGNNAKKQSPEQLVKMEQTLEDMEEVRKEDSIQLRQRLFQKETWLLQQQKNARELENKLKGRLKVIREKKLRIEGALTVLEEFLTGDK